MAKLLSFKKNKEKQTENEKQESIYRLQDINYILIYDGEHYKLVPFVYSNDLTAIKDLTTNATFEFTEDEEVKNINLSLRKLPNSAVQFYSKKGQIRRTYNGIELEEMFNYPVFRAFVTEPAHKKDFLHEKNFTVSDALHWYKTKTIKQYQVARCVNLYQKSIAKHQEATESKDFGRYDRNHKTTEIIYPYSIYSQNFLANDIYWLVGRTLLGKKLVVPFAIIEDTNTSFYYYANSLIDRNFSINCGIMYNNDYSEHDIEKAICKRYLYDYKNKIEYTLYKGNEIEKQYHAFIDANDKDYLKKINEFSCKILSVEDVVKYANVYYELANNEQSNTKVENTKETTTKQNEIEK